VLVQSYLQQQLVIAGRSSYLRLWLLVTSINPLRAYLYDGGVAIFGKQKGAGAPATAGNSSSSSSSSEDLIVNLWIQDRNSTPMWSLNHLAEYLKRHPETVLPLPEKQQQQQQQRAKTGRLLLQANSSSSSGGGAQQRRTFADAMSDMRTSASLVLAAALPAMRAAAVSAEAPHQGPFEYFGLDFVLDAHLQPWMLEVNAIPSLSRRKKSECTGDTATSECKLTAASSSSNSGNSSGGGGSGNAAGTEAEAVLADFDAQKEQFVHDMLAILGLPVDGSSPSPAAAAADPTDAAGLLRKAAAAAAAAGIRYAPTPAPAAANQSSSSSSTDRRLHSQRSWRQLLQHSQHHHRRRPNVSAVLRAHRRRASSRTGGEVGSSSSSSSPEQGYKGVVGLQWSGPAPGINQLPQQLQKLLCPASTTTSSSSSSSSNEFACISCLTAEDLAALAAAEGELQRAGKFVPIHDLITAHRTNTQALQDAKSAPGTAAASGTADGTAGTADDTAGTAVGGNGIVPPGAADSTAAAAGKAEVTAGDLYLSSNPSVWQKLFLAWKGMSKGHVGLRDLAIMKHHTSVSTVSAEKGLGLQRLDYVMSAWLRVRKDETCDGSPPVDCVVKRLQLLVSNCYL
jgi:hypothetical protein